MAGDQPLNLLDLPVDILALILTPLVRFDTVIELCPCPDHGELGGRLEVARSVLLVHPHVHAIACPMLYSLNTFNLSIVPGAHGGLQAKMLQAYHHGDASSRARRAGPVLHDECPADDVAGCSLAAEERRGEMGRLQLFVTPSARRRVRHFTLDVGRHRGWIDQAVTPVLSDMILAGRLASLRITLLYRAVGPRNGFAVQNSRVAAPLPTGDAVIFTKPPLRGFFQVLADPDLESARLLLAGGHPPVWCKYHEKGSDHDGEGAECPSLAVVDWRSIVREVLDPEGRSTAAPMVGG
ncbi:hypothetical protein V2A60_007711 [Cordyceps javanica]